MNPLMIVLVGGAIMLVALVVVLLVAKSSLQAWLRGDGFRDWAVRKAAAALHARIELDDPTWDGSEVYSDLFRARGYEEAAFADLQLDGVRAKAGGIEDGAFVIPEVTVNRLGLNFSGQRLAREKEAERPAATGSSAAPEVPGWLKRYLPNRVEVDRIEIASANVAVEEEGGARLFGLTEVRTEVKPDFPSQVWEFSGRGGKMFVPDQPEIRLKDLGLRWKGSDLFIDRCALGIYDQGHIDGVGEIGFEGDGMFDVELTISAIDVDELVEGDWRDRLDGKIDGPIRISGPPGQLVYEGTLNVTNGVVESIPVLKRVAQYTRTERFNRLALSQATTDFKKNGDRVELRGLVLQSDGLVRVEGDIDIVGRDISGNLQLGIVPGTMRWIPGAERSVFVEDRDGFRWTAVTLAGTVDEPKEDLSARLIAAAGSAIVEELPQGLIDEAQKLLGGEDGTASPSGVIEKGRQFLDLLTPVIPGR